MMAQRSSNAPPYVIGPHCMALNAYNVILVTHSRGDHSITDHDYKIMFKVNPVNKMLRDQLVLLDVCGKILITLREKVRSVHKRWNVFKGKSENISDIIFSVRKQNRIQCGTNLHVFLADKKSSEEFCDFNITGSWSKKNCSIYDSSRIIAQMRPMQATDRFTVTIFPNVDLAFVITLIATIDTMKTSNNDDDHCHARKVIAQVGKVGKVVAKGVVSIAGQVIGVNTSDND
ncbi:LURP-one-related 10-like protein [Tanacetum coccineum]|uniref:LURP-one-related 10-like protein n=1 Tax=Tanacetum coccineum TaxID=301880 RepID=A0ABQ4XET3_9ASTR